MAFVVCSKHLFQFSLNLENRGKGFMRRRLISYAIILTGLSTIALAPNHANAEGIHTIREIISNNIYQCSSNKAWESLIGGSNVSYTELTLSIICLDDTNSARWIMKSSVICEGDYCNQNMLEPYQATYNQQTRTNTYRNLNVTVGTNCELRNFRIDSGSRDSYTQAQWTCENIMTPRTLTVSTVGRTESLYIGQYYSQYGSPPNAIDAALNPANMQQRDAIRDGQLCYGSSRFCAR